MADRLVTMQMALSKEWSFLLGKGSYAGEGVVETVGGALDMLAGRLR